MLKQLSEIQTLFKRVHASQRVLFLSHQKPDGDTTGSALAFAAYLDTQGIAYDLGCKDDPDPIFSFLPNFSQYQNIQNLNPRDYDTVIVFDSGSLEYAGVENFVQQVRNNIFLVNIDHHHTNSYFADINIVDTSLSSTCEVLQYMFEVSHIEINHQMASCLLNGEMTDTSVFTNAGTKQSTFDAASRLLSYGAMFNTIIEENFKNKNPEILMDWGKVLSDLRTHPKFNLVYAIVPEALSENVTGLSNFIMSLKGFKRIMVLNDTGKGIKGSFRTNDFRVDVSRLAQYLNGGGHKMAAGFFVNAKLVKNSDGSWTVI